MGRGLRRKAIVLVVTSICCVMMLTTIVLGQRGGSNAPPPAVMEKFYGYLNGSYSLYLGDDRGACSHHVDPAGIRPNGSDRFFLAKRSRGKVGTGCRGVLEFQVMQADCKTRKLYQFTREQNADPRVAGWERYEIVLSDPQNSSQPPQSQKALATICR
jgi:hypothetical protein